MGFAVLGCLFPLPALITLGIGYFLYSVLVANASFVAAIVAFLACYLVYFIVSAFYALKTSFTSITALLLELDTSTPTSVSTPVIDAANTDSIYGPPVRNDFLRYGVSKAVTMSPFV